MNNTDVKIINILREVIPRKKAIYTEEPHAMRNSYICANPNGTVSNLNCPEEDPMCNCPCKDGMEEDGPGIEYAVVKKEPGNEIPELVDEPAFFITLEAAKIRLNQIPIIYDEPTRQDLTKLLQEAKECEKVEELLGEEYLGCLWEDPNSPMSCSCPCIGDKFMDYIRYTRTSATFWNTPDYVPLYSIAQKALLESQVIGISINGDFSIRPGDIIYLDIDEENIKGLEEIENIPERVHTINSSLKNSKFKGRWMVRDITHKVTGVQLHKMDLILIRDSFPVDNKVEEDPGVTTPVSGTIESLLAQSYTVFGTDTGYSSSAGWYYPVYTTKVDDTYHAHSFIEYPDTTFYMPENTKHHAIQMKPSGYKVYSVVEPTTTTITPTTTTTTSTTPTTTTTYQAILESENLEEGEPEESEPEEDGSDEGY